MVQVHTTFSEHPIEMPEEEAESLRAQGLIRDAPAAGEPPAGDGRPGTPPSGGKPAQGADTTKKES